MDDTKQFKHGVRILVIDDDPVIYDLYCDILAQEGYELIFASNARVGLTQLEQEYFDLVLLDLKLPDMYGTDVAKEISINHPNVSVIIVTGNPTSESMLEAIKAGAYDYIIKPFYVDDFKISIRRVVEKIVLTKENQRLSQELLDKEKQLEERVKLLEQEIDRLKNNKH